MLVYPKMAQSACGDVLHRRAVQQVSISTPLQPRDIRSAVSHVGVWIIFILCCAPLCGHESLSENSPQRWNFLSYFHRSLWLWPDNLVQPWWFINNQRYRVAGTA